MHARAMCTRGTSSMYSYVRHKQTTDRQPSPFQPHNNKSKRENQRNNSQQSSHCCHYELVMGILFYNTTTSTIVLIIEYYWVPISYLYLTFQNEFKPPLSKTQKQTKTNFNNDSYYPYHYPNNIHTIISWILYTTIIIINIITTTKNNIPNEQ